MDNISCYLIIFRKNKIIATVRHESVHDAVSHQLNWGDVKFTGFGLSSRSDVDYLLKEMDNVMLQNYSNAISYHDGTYGVVFSSKWIDGKYDLSTESLMWDVYNHIKSLERNLKINNILDK